MKLKLKLKDEGGPWYRMAAVCVARGVVKMEVVTHVPAT